MTRRATTTSTSGPREYARLAEDVVTVVGAIPDGFWRAVSPALDEPPEPSWPDRS